MDDMKDYKKQHVDTKDDDVQRRPLPNNLYNLFNTNFDVYQKIARGLKVPLKAVSHQMRNLERVPINLAIPPAYERILTNHSREMPLQAKNRNTHQKLANMRLTESYKIVSLTCHCNQDRVRDIYRSRFILTTPRNAIDELRYHNMTMRDIADFVPSQTHLTSISFDSIYMTGVDARTIGDMLRNSSNITKLAISRLDLDAFQI